MAACDQFIYTEILRQKPEELKPEDASTLASNAEGEVRADSETKAPAVAELPKLKPMVLKALEAVVRDDGWATLSSLGSQLNRNHPSFDSRNYGVTKLGDLMRKKTYLETKEVPVGDAGQHVDLQVRRKPASASVKAV